MLDDMSQKGKINSQKDTGEESAINKKIMLSDREFGKY
jgi:hypothetical protein